MKDYLIALKDLLVIFSPIIVAYISYRSNKKSKRDIQNEIEKTLREKDAETNQILQRINAEMETQKQLISWNNAIPQTNEYTDLAGTERYGNISGITLMISNIRSSIDNGEFSVADLLELKNMLQRINLPNNSEVLYPYEIPYLMSYKKLVKDIEEKLQKSEKGSEQTNG